MKSLLKNLNWKKALSKNALFAVLIALLVLFTLFQPKFISLMNLRNILMQNAYMIVVVCGVTIIMISGGTDLSVAFEMALSGIIMAAGIMWWGLPIWFSVLLGIITAIVLAITNGLLSVTLKIHPLMVTLATMTIFKGIAYLITQSTSIFGLPDSFKFIGQGSVLGIPLAGIIMVLAIVFTGLFLNKSYLGRFTYAVGSNPEASRLAGIDVKKMKVFAFGLGGMLIGFGAVLLLARSGSANATMAAGTEFDAITACVLGGIALKGGEGNIYGPVIGVLILGVLANGMQLLGFDLNAQYIAKGVLLLAAIGFDTYQRANHKQTITLKEAESK